MAWITSADVSAAVQTDLSGDPWIDATIDRAQALAEIEVGVQEGPGAGLKAVLTEIAARMWRAGKMAEANPAGLQQETTGPFGYQAPQAGAAGLGLTDREKNALSDAVGRSPIGTLATTRSNEHDHGLDTPPVIVQDPLVDVFDAEADEG